MRYRFSIFSTYDVTVIKYFSYITVNGGAKADIGLRECARITPDDVEVLIA